MSDISLNSGKPEESESAPVYKHFVPTALFLTDPEEVPEIMHHLLHAFRVLSDYAISSGGLLLLALSVSTRSLSLPVLTSLTGRDARVPGTLPHSSFSHPDAYCLQNISCL